MYCTVLYCTVLYCTVLYCTVQDKQPELAPQGAQNQPELAKQPPVPNWLVKQPQITSDSLSGSITGQLEKNKRKISPTGQSTKKTKTAIQPEGSTRIQPKVPQPPGPKTILKHIDNTNNQPIEMEVDPSVYDLVNEKNNGFTIIPNLRGANPEPAPTNASHHKNPPLKQKQANTMDNTINKKNQKKTKDYKKEIKKTQKKLIKIPKMENHQKNQTKTPKHGNKNQIKENPPKKSQKTLKKTKKYNKTPTKPTKKIQNYQKMYKKNNKKIKTKKTLNKLAHIKNGNHNLTVLNWNKGSARLYNRINHLQHIIQKHKPHILAIHELNFQVNDDKADIAINGYNWEMDNLIHKNGRSRTALLIREDIRYSRRLDLEINNDSHVWITVNLHGGKKYNIQSYYRQWQEMGTRDHIPGTLSPASQRERLTSIANQWKSAIREGITFSFSDTNLNTNSMNLNPNEMSIQDRKHIQLMRILQSEVFNSGTSYINTEDTRYNHFTKSTDKIDHCITTNPELVTNHQIIKSGDSDHYIGKFTIKTKYNPSHPRFIIKRDYQDINWDQLRESLRTNPKLSECLLEDNPSRICKSIQDTLTHHLDQQAPTKKVQITKKVPVFITSETKELIKERDEALRIAKEDYDQDSWRKFRHLKNLCHKNLSKDKKKYLKEQLDTNNDDHDKWESAKQILGWKTTNSPTVLQDRGKTVTSPAEIAESLNFNFLSKVAKIVRNIPKTEVDPLENYSKLMTNKVCTLTIQPIGIIELRKLVTKLKSSRSAGIDGLSTKFLKKVFKQIEHQILHMINQSILTGIYPETLKTAKVLPLFKNSNPPKSQSDPGSYRGINILNSLGKILDKVLLRQVLSYLIDNELIHESHHGSVKGRSTTTAIATIIDTWTNLIEQGNEVAAVAMDQSAAYDLIDHPILLMKMEKLGIQPNGIKLFKDYLQNRQQSVYLDGTMSSTLHIGNRSVVQGSVLSCALYLIYILDIPLLFHQSSHTIPQAEMCQKPSLQTFVDDIMCTIRRITNKPLQESIIESIDVIEIYMNSNKLSLNRDKTQLMVLNKDPPLKSQVSIPATPKDITPKQTLTFLGVILSETLTWHQFLVDGKANLYSQLQTRVSAIKKLRKSTDFAFARNLANALFIGKFNYAAEIWGGAPKYIIKRFQSLQLEVARSVIGPKSFMWNKKTLLEKMSWMSIEQLLGYTSNKLTYKILHMGQPTLLAARYNDTKLPVINNTRLTGHNKLGSRPRNVGRTRLTRAQYRPMSYFYYSQIPEEIQNLSVYKHFCKWMQKWYKYGARTPNEKCPTFEVTPDKQTIIND